MAGNILNWFKAAQILNIPEKEKGSGWHDNFSAHELALMQAPDDKNEQDAIRTLIELSLTPTATRNPESRDVGRISGLSQNNVAAATLYPDSSGLKINLYDAKPFDELLSSNERAPSTHIVSWLESMLIDINSTKQLETVANDGVDSRDSQIKQSNNNEFEFSGLLNIPGKVDAWFRAIDDMTRNFQIQSAVIPNETQAWVSLMKAPPTGYEITTGMDKGEDCLLMPGEKLLSKSAFSKRWKKYSAIKSQ